MVGIDVTYQMFLDTPAGKDPDSHSPTLRRYHQTLWNKRLPTGDHFGLSIEHPNAYLYHQSGQSEFFLSSDSITHSYRHTKKMSHIIEQVPDEEINDLVAITSTIGGFTIFPSKRRNGKPTINGARGMNAKIRDRFDLTLECIRRHYQGEASPLSPVLERYADFFDLFGSFTGYVEFFLLDDLLQENGEAVDFWLPFDNFERSAFPEDLGEYLPYRDNLVSFVSRRNRRIKEQGS